MLIHSELTETQPCILSQTVVILLSHAFTLYSVPLDIKLQGFLYELQGFLYELQGFLQSFTRFSTEVQGFL